MTYIILIAGKGAKLQPLTLKHPKTLYRLDKTTTVLQRTVRSIRKYDKQAEIVAVVGFMYENIIKQLEQENVFFVHNPFYAITNSIASLWFAKKYLERGNVTIINGDIVLDDAVVNDILVKPTDMPYALVDSTIQDSNAYNMQVHDEKVCVMSKQLTKFYGKYASVLKLDPVSSRLLEKKLEEMIKAELYDQVYESAVVQMIFENDFELFYRDIKDYKWTEIDCVDDLLKAKGIHRTKG